MNPFILPITLLLVAAAIFAVTERDKIDAWWEKVRPRKKPIHHPRILIEDVEAVVRFEEIFGFAPEHTHEPQNVNRAAARLVVLQAYAPQESEAALDLLRFWAPALDWITIVFQEEEAIRQSLAALNRPASMDTTAFEQFPPSKEELPFVALSQPEKP